MLVKLPLCVIFLFFSVIIVATIHAEWHDERPRNGLRTEQLSYRLNNFTEPLFYELWIKTEIEKEILDYTGRVRITLAVLEPTKFITIHSLVRILHYSLVNDQNRQIHSTFDFNNDTEIITFLLSEEIHPGSNYTLDIEFTEKINDQSRGFFVRRYIEEDKQVSYLASTYLHSGNARFALPCYDEPRYRTPFIIHITHNSSLQAISNMPIESVENSTNGYVMTTFQETPPTTINLIIFTVTDYASRTLMGPRDISLTIYAPKNFIHEVDFALEYSIPVLSRIEAYLGYEYNLPKLDYISVLDFIHLAMENWGTFLFDSQYMLFKESTTTENQRMRMARVITHELLHNFFGSLVGVKWWSDLWMMEAFANLGEFYFTDVFMPEYNYKEIYVTEVLHRSLDEHAFIGVRPVASYIEQPRDVRRYLEGYLSKAGLIMRMFMYAFGEEVFQNFIQSFIRTYAFDTATPEDLYLTYEKALEEELDMRTVKMSDVLRSWFEQPGYPLLIVQRDYETNEVIIKQQRFLSARNESDHTNYSWYIPLSISTSRDPTMENTRPWKWLRPDVNKLVLKPESEHSWGEDDWILFNIQQTGYFRINYDTQNWRLLAKELHQGYPFRIPPLNRAQLIDDSFNLAYSDIIDFPLALDIIKYVINEDQYTIWQAANNHLMSLDRRLDGPSYEKYFGRFLQHLTEEHLDKLDVFENIHPNESISSISLRPIIVDLACRAGSGKCLTATRVLVMAESMTGHRLVPREQSSVYYCHGLKNANYETFQYFREKLHNLYHEQERSHLSHSLTCYHDKEVVMDVLLSTIAQDSPEFMYSGLERQALLGSAVRNGHVRPAIDFFQEHHQEIAVAYGFSITMEGLLRSMTAYLHLKDDIAAFVDMLETLEMAKHISDLEKRRILDEMEHNFEWVEDNKEDIERWIQNYFEPGSMNSAAGKFLSLGIIFLATYSNIFI
ncbi:aminopeptidase N-like [Phlebotomus argentipes]|uniref:aminopeptidase N-like n=1 Tax=Phlebotomus argentipes TaxID=94469 RepID=UPI0028931297|nr:aminopeptidase N-like [Phlebotomus argentipes]